MTDFYAIDINVANVYSALKAFRFPEHLQALRDGKLLSPVHVRIKPINACNHHCWFCAYRADNLQLGEEMRIKDRIPKEKFSEIVNDLIEMKVRAVTFSGGGEPLIYPGIATVIHSLGRGGIKIGSLTNGSFLRGDVADALAEHGTWVRVSMDAGDATTYAKSRGLKEDEFHRVVENISTFAKRNSKCTLGISFIVSKDSAGQIYEFCRMAKAAGVSHVKISSCVIGNSATENNQYHSAFRDIATQQIKKALELNDSKFEVVNHYHEMEQRFDKSYTFCPYLQFLTIIGADCKVYTCQDKAYTESGCLGSIVNRSFQDFWFSEENQKRIRNLNPSKECKHHCVSHQKNEILNSFLSLEPEHADFV